MFEMGNTLKQLRFEKKLTQEDVAESIGVSRASYNLWEQNHRSPSKKYIMSLSKFYNVDPNYLLGYSSSRKQGVKQISIPMYFNGNTTAYSISLPSEMLPENDNFIANAKNIDGNIQIVSLIDKKVVMTINRY